VAAIYGTLRVIAGAGAGRTLKLQKLVSVIGSAKGSDLQLEGEKVAENHASIEASPDGTCVLRNRSPYGTLVNKARVDVHRLADGDRIQIGAAALLEFHGTGAKVPRAGGATNSRKILIGAGLGVYLIAMIAVAVSLSDDTSSSAAVSAAQLDEALKATRSAMVAKLADAKSPPANVPVDADDATAAYYKVINARASGADASVVNADLDAFISEVREHLQEGAALERQERFKEARVQYRRVLEMLPDMKLRAASLAANRLVETKEKLPDE
jgi:hypothetical protein